MRTTSTTVAAVVAALLAMLVPSASGHAWLVEPPARNSKAGPRNGYTPQSGNGRGVCGDGGQWPQSSNYLGGQNEGPLRTYTAGEVVEFEVEFTAHHMGHMELHICEEHLGPLTRDPEGPNGCLKKWTLERVLPEEVYSDCVVDDSRDDCQLRDEDYPERWYLSPGTGTHKMHFRIPAGLQCQSCTLQWRWWTANSCQPALGYGCYFQKLGAIGWAASSWCGAYCGTCGESSLLQADVSLGSSGCGEEFRNCADITVLASGSPAPPRVPAPTPMPTPTLLPTPMPMPTPALEGSCVQDTDCTVNYWCNDAIYEQWCPLHGAVDCPSPQCVMSGQEPMPSSAPAPTPLLSPSPSFETCVSQSVLTCINDYSGYWPKCDPGQSKNNAGPDGYEFGLYCTQEWVDALNAVLSDPVVDKCGDSEAIQKFLAQVAYETGYYSTVYQPLDGGAGLIHMIPGNWVPNAEDMDVLWPGSDFAEKVASMGKDFFQTAAYGWRSVAAWFKSTNRVIPGCGRDLFDQSFEDQTKCILGRVVSRQEAYAVVGECMAQNPTPTPQPPTTAVPMTPTLTTSSIAAPTKPAPTMPSTTVAPTTPMPTMPAPGGCVHNTDCSVSPWCNDETYVEWCPTHSWNGNCPSPMCTMALSALQVPTKAARKRVVAHRHDFLATALIQAKAVLERSIPALSVAEEL